MYSNMSVPPPYVQRNTSTDQSKEDCRDYLRTGRCKYGTSCKYNHPLNVQSGGGMKAPIDPSEPLFPERPNEPLCQYYMKHGTCKFGQTCKFNHPPQSSLPSVAMHGNTMLVGTGRKNDAPQMVWNPSGGDTGVQLLPQRPEEPNCIFFLKNGRCKYGSTCRYHHPLNYHDRRAGDDGRRQHMQVQQVSSDSMLAPKIHYVTSLPPGAYQQGGHFVVADGSVTFVSLDGSTPAQVISVPPGSKDGTVVYASAAHSGRPLGLSRELASSSSSTSIASSFETTSSNVDPMMGTHGDSSSSLWNRPRRSLSGNSLNAYNIPENNTHGRAHVLHGGRPVLVQNSKDPSLNLPRVVSTSSASEMYYDSSGYGRQGQHHSQAGTGSHGSQWRERRSSSFDHSRPGTSSLYHRDEDIHESPARSHDEERMSQSYHHRETQPSPMMRGRPPPGARPRRPHQNLEVDDGLSMMTSALLTMLDTPEEAAAEHYDGYGYEEPGDSSSQIPTPRMRPHYPAARANRSPNPREDERNYQSGQYMPSASYYEQNSQDDQALGLMMPSHENRLDHPYERDDRFYKTHGQPNEDQSNWAPSWHGQTYQGRSLQENAHAMPVVQSQPSSNSAHDSSHVGLYL